MYISSININNTCYTKSQLRNNNAQLSFCACKLKTDVLELKQGRILKMALEKFKNLSLAEYKALTDEEKCSLRKALNLPEIFTNFYPKDYTEQHNFAAESVKQNLDEMYGEGNYTVITVGRSLSTIGKSLAARIGEDNVINLPVSGISFFTDIITTNEYTRLINSLNEKCKKEDLVDFLIKNQLSKQQINNSDHMYVLMDYSVTGQSLQSVYTLLTQDDIWGKGDNITYLSINEVLPDKHQMTPKIISNLYNENYKECSPVAKCYNLTKKNLKDSMNYLNFYSDKAAKKVQLFIFSLYDSYFNKDDKYSDENLVIDKNSYDAQKYKFKRDYFIDLCKLLDLSLKYQQDLALTDLLKIQRPYNVCNRVEYYQHFRPKFFETIKSYQ